ncbi:MAG: DNA/RNA non-specific endonuclease [Muribaculaceae bacterium]|nr:DNA/RNA non-specific endonuclease [Muribaculaceae bacterium]
MAGRRRRRNRVRRAALAVCLLILSVAFLLPDDAGMTARRVENGADVAAAMMTNDWNDYAAAETNADLDLIMIDYSGFKVSFNPVAHIPNWVAWTITADRLSHPVVSRSQGSFSTDRNVAGCATAADYRRSGYDRGHMAPAADMKWDSQAMKDCFMFTNIAPQATSLNTGAWNKLEQACRNIASVDSLGKAVVICGPVMTQGYRTTIGDSQVVVPPAFFKVVLYRRADGNPATIGFIMNNGKVDGGMQSCAMTVDRVEEITGHDFFTTLPDSIERAIESTFDFYNFSTGR